jgi:hypothetical protein
MCRYGRLGAGINTPTSSLDDEYAQWQSGSCLLAAPEGQWADYRPREWKETKMRKLVFLMVIAMVVTVSGPAVAAPPEVFVDPVVGAFLEGDSGGRHYEIQFLGTQGPEAQLPNAAVEVEVFDSGGLSLGVCNFGEGMLTFPSALAIGPGLRTASFSGTVPFGECLELGDAAFDLDWIGTGGLFSDILHSGRPDEICHQIGKQRPAVASGTVEFSSVPSFSVNSDPTLADVIVIETRCLRPGRPELE